MPDASEKAHRGFASRVRSWWSNLSYTARLTITFAFVSAMTAVVAFGVLSFVWQQYFQTYTHDNMDRIARTTATNIGDKYADAHGNWYTGALSPAASIKDFYEGVGVQVIDTDGNTLFDSSRSDGGSVTDPPNPNSDNSLAPTSKSSLVQTPIISNGKNVGYVNVWVYGSSTMLTKSDEAFRQNSYQAIAYSSMIAVVLSVCLGFLFAHSFVKPIDRVTKAAKRLEQGDLSARTGLTGDDEISQLGQTFDAMADSVQKNQTLERQLTTDVAHELRTPLMAIQSTVEAIIDGVFKPDKERLTTIDSEVKRLSRLVSEILRLSRLQNGSIELHRQTLNVGDLISGIISTHEALVKDKGLQLIYKAKPDVHVYGDPDMIRQAVANLISNAVRYTDKGSITVTVDKGDQMAQIAVADTGVGLSPEEAKMVFSRFWRADSARSRVSGGLGIGLSMVHEIVDQHNGWVRVEGEPGVGATFTIFIPLFNEDRIKEEKDREKRTTLTHGEDEWKIPDETPRVDDKAYGDKKARGEQRGEDRQHGDNASRHDDTHHDDTNER